MLISIVKYLYILFVYLFVFITVLLDDFVYNYETILLVMYVILFIPGVEFILNKVKTLLIENDVKRYLGEINVVKYKKEILSIIFGVSCLFLFEDNLFKFGVVYYFLLSFLYDINYRITLYLSFLVLLFVPIFVVIQRVIFIEYSVVYASYLLVVGIIQFLYKTLKIKPINIIQKIENFVLKNYEKIFYFSIVFLSIILIGAFYFPILNKLALIGVFFIIIFYFFIKLLGFEIKYDKFLKNINFSSFFSISLIVCSFFIALVDTSVINRKKLVVVLLGFCFYVILFSIETKILPFFIKQVKTNGYIKFMLSVMLILLMGVGINFKYYRYMQGMVILKEKQKQEEEIEKTVKKKSLYSVFKDSDFDTNLYQGSVGEKVKVLQKYLKLEGYFQYEVSGVYDEKTKYGVSKYLTEVCLWESNQGVIGPLARECIMNNIKKKVYSDKDEK